MTTGPGPPLGDVVEPTTPVHIWPFGLFVSLDMGKSWEKFMNDYPTVRTDDIYIHPRDGDLIVATHGQSVFIADDIRRAIGTHGGELRGADHPGCLYPDSGRDLVV